jgi:hypothetical protein
MANQRNQRNLLGPSETFHTQQKRFLAYKVAMCRNERVNLQIPKRQALCCVMENQFECFGKNGISGESSARNFLHEWPVAFRGRLARNHIFSDERV